MPRLPFILCAFFVFLCSTLPTKAYGPTGHRVIAEIAEKHLTAEARAAVKRILGNEFMAEAAYWPDEMKSSPDPYWKGDSYYYHFINLPDGVSYVDSEKNPRGDMIFGLNKFAEMLKDETTSPKDQHLALAFIIHIIGDMHQPLHAGRVSDLGGNRVDVVWFATMTNLHAVWDDHLIDHKKLSYTEWVKFLDAKVTPEQVTAWQADDPLDWVAEIIGLRGGIYEDGHGILSWDYVYEYTNVVKSQLSKGGIRLAGYLNALFAD